MMNSAIIASMSRLRAVSVQSSSGNFSTSFPATENPVSQGGTWLNGAADATHWHNMRTTPGLIFGVSVMSGGSDFTDNIALKDGTWTQNYELTATFFKSPGYNPATHEIELLAHGQRTAFLAGTAQFYESNFGLNSSSGPYSQIVKWNGTVGGFTLLDSRSLGSAPVTGDVAKVRVTVSGGVVTIENFINGTSLFSVTDSSSPYLTGLPGVGAYPLPGATVGNYGWSDLTVTPLP